MCNLFDLIYIYVKSRFIYWYIQRGSSRRKEAGNFIDDIDVIWQLAIYKHKLVV